MTIDYSDTVGWPARSTRVTHTVDPSEDQQLRRHYQERKKARRRRPAWLRALTARGSLR